MAGIKLFSLIGTFLDIESRFEQVEIKQTEDQQWKLASIVENGMKNFTQYLSDANRVNGTNNDREKKGIIDWHRVEDEDPCDYRD